MPVELAGLPPVYIVVGIFRFLRDPSIHRPILNQTQKAAKKGLVLALAWAVVTLPLTRWYVRHFMSSRILRYKEDATWLGVNLYSYATWLLVLQQASFVLEYFVAKELKIARAHAYEATVKSRGKSPDFWQPYVEEWKVPPFERARRSAQRQGFLMQANNRFVRLAIFKILLAPLSFIPFIGIIVSAALSSVTLARILHKPFFRAKGMTPQQEELFVVERLIEYRSFGFAAALVERIPIVGLVFSITNRIGAAAWAHDLEKRQHLFSSGQLKPTRRYESKTAALPDTDLPEDFAGGFPTKKGPVKITEESEAAASMGVLGESQVVPPPPLPPRSSKA